MSFKPFPDEWYQEAFPIPGLDQGAFDAKSLTEIFQEIDSDQKGYVTKADIRLLMNMIDEKVDEIDLDEMARLIDPENSGKITYEQFVEGFSNPSALYYNPVAVVDPSLAKLPTKKRRKPKDHVHDDLDVDLERAAQERHELFDALLDGAIMTRSELEDMASRFESMDKTRRGVIRYNDLLRGLERHDNEEIKHAFSALDRESKGEIDWRELVVGLSQFAEMSREEKVQFAFRMFDRDDNGTIDREEITRIVRSTAPSWAQPQWLSRRVDELYDSLSLKRITDIDLETFLLIAESHPGVIAPEILGPSS
jgi:Ca2+-binding EF-hand superfamily protein